MKTLTTVLLFLLLCSCATPPSQPVPDLKAFAAMVQRELFENYSAEAVRTYFREDYIQHNPHVPTGRAALEGFMPVLKEAQVTARTHRMLQDGDILIMHNSYDHAEAFGAKEIATFDIWRIQDGKIAEHWDVIQPIGPVNASGRSLLDGETEIRDLHKTESNKKLVRTFYEQVFVKGNARAVKTYIHPEIYLQHNPHVGDGVEALEGFLDFFLGQDPFIPSVIHQVWGEGNFVLVQSQAHMNGKKLAAYDLFRVEEDLIVEHWDLIQEIPETMAHDNGMF